MAGPHVAGVVALLWSAHPELVRDIEATKTVLQNTANPAVGTAQTCGGTPSTQIPNNSFGYGRVDALAAVNAGAGPANISTRLRVETGDNSLIGGFIVTGTQPKRVLVRAIGPSLPLLECSPIPSLSCVIPRAVLSFPTTTGAAPRKRKSSQR